MPAATDPESFAPYASAATVLSVINRYRDRGLPDVVTLAVLEQVGVTGGMAHRTHQTMRFLGLLDEEGNKLPAFERLKKASTAEFPSVLAELVRAAYLPVFTIVDPATDNEIAIADAFRRYSPDSQRPKMIRLFLGLCEASGIVPEGSTKKRTTAAAAASTSNGSNTSKTRAPKPRVMVAPPSVQQGAVDGGAGGGSQLDYQVVSAIIQRLPKDGKWNAEQRRRWLAAMTTAVDLLMELDEPLEESGDPFEFYRDAASEQRLRERLPNASP